MQKDESIYHNLYIEQQLLSSIEEGDKETVLKYYYEFNKRLFSSLSSFHQLRRHKNICISSITLATRYAIKGDFHLGLLTKFMIYIFKEQKI